MASSGHLLMMCGPDLAALDPEVPAPVIVQVVHPSEDGAVAAALRELDPSAVGERLVLLQVARPGELRRDALRFGAVPRGERLVGRQALGGDRGGERRGRGVREPGVILAASGDLAGLDGGLGGGDLGGQGVPSGAVVGVGDEDDRGRVLDVAVHRGLRRVVEEGRELVELLLAERVELVVVADRAPGGQAEPDLRGRLGPIPRVQDDVFLVDRPAFAGRDVAAVEPRGHLLLQGAVGEQVARELLDGELVERLVAVERLDDRLAIRPDLAIVVDVDAVRVAVPRGVEPVPGAMLSPARGRHQLVDVFLVGVGRRVAHERLDVGGAGGRPFRSRLRRRARVRRSASGGGLQAGGLQLRQDEVVDRGAGPRPVLDRGRGHLPGRDVRPVRLILGPRADPRLEQFFLLGRQNLVRFGGRHHFELVGREDPARSARCRRGRRARCCRPRSPSRACPAANPPSWPRCRGRGRRSNSPGGSAGCRG